MLRVLGNLYSALRIAYPEASPSWDPNKFASRTKKSKQRYTLTCKPDDNENLGGCTSYYETRCPSTSQFMKTLLILI